MGNVVFVKTMKNGRKHRILNLYQKIKKRNYFMSGPNYHTTKCFSENLLAIEMK